MEKPVTQTTTSGNVPINQKRLEDFVHQRYHWKSLSTDEQLQMARELLELRAFLFRLKEGLG
jgi:hypothetical protein